MGSSALALAISTFLLSITSLLVRIALYLNEGDYY